VFGVEVDGQWSDQGKTTNISTISFTDKVDWFATARVRAGAASDRFLVYATAGGLYEGLSRSLSSPFGSATASTQKVGWAAGLGIEGAITQNVTLRAEYLFTQTSDWNTTVFGILMNTRVSDSIVRAAVNFKFGG
jgi:outer membrane immunogenic protein